MPEVKIRKAVRALWARSALSSALLRSNLRDSHFQTGGIATDYMPQIYDFSIGYQQKKIEIAAKTALPPCRKSNGFLLPKVA